MSRVRSQNDIAPFSFSFSFPFSPSLFFFLIRLTVYRSRLSFFFLSVCGFLSLSLLSLPRSALRLYPRQLFFLPSISTRHFSPHGSFHSRPVVLSLVCFPALYLTLASSLSLSLSRPYTYPSTHPPTFLRTTPAETYFLERQSSAAPSHFAPIDRPRVVSQLTKSGFALRIHLRSAKSRSPVCTHRSR